MQLRSQHHLLCWPARIHLSSAVPCLCWPLCSAPAEADSCSCNICVGCPALGFLPQHFWPVAIFPRASLLSWEKKKLINGTNKSETQAYFYLKVKTWPSHKYSELCQAYFNGAHNEKSILCHLYPWWNLLIRNMERLVFSACKGEK